MNHTSTLVKLYAVCQGALGVLLLLVPESAGLLDSSAETPGLVLYQLIGAAFIGFAFGNWTARESILGGIYGRAVVVGNQTFSFIGTMVVVGDFPDDPEWGYYFLAAVLLFGMILFSILQFRPSWLDRSK